jgi:hypothetical protein
MLSCVEELRLSTKARWHGSGIIEESLQQLQGIFTSQDKNSTCADFLMSSKGKKPPFLKAGNWSMAETEYRLQSGTIRHNWEPMILDEKNKAT